jgi:hypothetical protein
MGRTYCRIVCDQIVFQVTDEQVVSRLWDFRKPVPLGEIVSVETTAKRQSPRDLLLTLPGLVIGVLMIYLLLRDRELGPVPRVAFWGLSIVFIITFGVVLRNYLTRPRREIRITTAAGKSGLLFWSDDPATFDSFHEGLQKALVDRNTPDK